MQTTPQCSLGVPPQDCLADSLGLTPRADEALFWAVDLVSDGFFPSVKIKMYFTELAAW